jgi:hypothetical protein
MTSAAAVPRSVSARAVPRMVFAEAAPIAPTSVSATIPTARATPNLLLTPKMLRLTRKNYKRDSGESYSTEPCRLRRRGVHRRSARSRKSAQHFPRKRNSSSRWRFRPPRRLTFRFRVQPSGGASSYSRSVLDAGGNLGASHTARKGVENLFVALCGVRVGVGRDADLQASRAPRGRTSEPTGRSPDGTGHAVGLSRSE